MEKVKTKVRFTSLDVAAMVQNLQRFIGMRATNIYDLNPSTYIIKLAKSQQKALILIENGVRFHTVDQKIDKKEIPSGFTMKFRKFLRSKRLESVRQVGVERVVVFTFGTEAYTNHLILQLYAQGNIILTDSDYKILQCIRSHEFNEKVKTAVGQIYPFEYAANIYMENIDISLKKIEDIFTQEQQKNENEGNQVQTKKKKKNNQKKQGTKLRDIVFKLIPCLFPAVIENILLGQKIDSEVSVGKENLEQVEEAAKVCFKFLRDFLKLKHTGFLYSRKDFAEKEEKQYFQFSPYKNLKFEQTHSSYKHETFDAAVAQYFDKYKKSQHQQQQQFEELAWKKYEQIKRDQQLRVKKLQQEQDIYKVKAQYIEKNLHDVQAIIKIIKTMQDNGLSWDAIQRMVLESKKNGDPLANMIHQLNINKRQVVILLGDPSSEQQHFDLLPVEVNIDYNAYTNATIYYESKKKNYQKQLRTKQASQQVLKIAEKDALKIIQRKKNEQFSKSIPTRKQFWFEKFYWFISSEGVLVISGRDSHQNQLIVKRYMKPGDLYMHSDYGGAASTVIKLNSKQVGIPRTTLEEAAAFTVCRSKAWDTKILSGAWWVHHDQVSKSAPTGEFLPTGSFMIRGKRNFIQPNRMQMGITFLFKIDQESAKRHLNDRKIHAEEEKEQSQQLTSNEKIQQSQQFAIISVQTAPKEKNQKNQGKGGKQQQNQPQLKKQDSKKPVVDITEDNEDDSQDGENESQNQQERKQAKKGGKQQNDKKKVNQQQQPKQRMKNKRKLKKLEKYLEEQDQEQREIIMKMIGARQMKHRQQEEVEEEKGKGKVKNKNKKKGIEKYIGNSKKDDSDKINTEKVLFLKKKQEGQSDSSSEQKEQNNKINSQEKQTNNLQIQINQRQTEKKQNQQDQNNQGQQKQQEAEQSSGGQEEKEEQQQPKQEQKKEEEEQVDEKALNSEIAELFKLVGKAHPEDKVENLVTMCAPYNSIKDNRFKIKLVPGGLKKGKAARNILHYFLNSNDLNEVQKPLVKTIPEQELINSLIGNVKLAGAGLLKLQQKEKADKKTKKKESEKKQKNG